MKNLKYQACEKHLGILKKSRLFFIFGLAKNILDVSFNKVC